MPGLGERAYAYAKSCGIMGKSYIGKRTVYLEKAERLSELDRMIFPASPGNLPEKELLAGLEKRIEERAVNSIISVAKCFSKLPEFLVLLIRAYEYADLKTAIASSIEKEEKKPPHTPIGRFQTVRFGAWPNIRKMIDGTDFEFLLNLKPEQKHDIIYIQSILDKHYYDAIRKALFSMPPHDRKAAEKIIADEISLKNCSCVLRLRTYYNIPPEKLKKYLVNEKAEDAIRCLDLPLDNFPSWSSWRWREFLNGESPGKQWYVDPRFFQNAASHYLYRQARRNFHQNSMSLDSVFCFVKLKQFEEDILTSSAEGLGIGLTIKEVFSVLGVE